MQKIIVLNSPQSWKFDIDGVEVISTREYLSNPRFASMKNVRVFNLSQDYSYQSKGYYVSLLAEARGHKPLPDVKTLLDIKAPALVKIVSESLEDTIQRSLKGIKSKEVVLNIYFGQYIAKQYAALTAELHRLFQSPFMQAKFSFNKKWILQNIRSISMKEIPEEHMEYIRQFAIDYFSKKRYDSPRPDKSLYDLAILYTPDTEAPPSNKQAIHKFIETAEKNGFYVEVITQNDFSRLPAFDALFIRDNTSVNNHTYKFARRAESDGVAIVDYPDTILKCNNKVYIAELLQLANIPTPKTMIVHQENKNEVVEMLGLPCVLKLPDSTFSFGVKKVETLEELNNEIKRLLDQSDMILAQQYMYTDFDWRIGILDGKAIFACKYFMAKDHWQIYNWKARLKKEQSGDFACVSVETVPESVIKTALKSVSLVYNKGLFGVDIKEVEGKPYVIEINDNPNVDFGIEDLMLKDELYLAIIRALKNRIEEKTGILNGHKAEIQAV